MNGAKHSCGSVNKCGDTMASSAWVTARVEKTYMGLKELQQELKKYHFEVPYVLRIKLQYI
jgi:hypothetical protein